MVASSSTDSYVAGEDKDRAWFQMKITDWHFLFVRGEMTVHSHYNTPAMQWQYFRQKTDGAFEGFFSLALAEPAEDVLDIFDC